MLLSPLDEKFRLTRLLNAHEGKNAHERISGLCYLRDYGCYLRDVLPMGILGNHINLSTTRGKSWKQTFMSVLESSTQLSLNPVSTGLSYIYHCFYL